MPVMIPSAYNSFNMWSCFYHRTVNCEELPRLPTGVFCHNPHEFRHAVDHASVKACHYNISMGVQEGYITSILLERPFPVTLSLSLLWRCWSSISSELPVFMQSRSMLGKHAPFYISSLNPLETIASIRNSTSIAPGVFRPCLRLSLLGFYTSWRRFSSEFSAWTWATGEILWGCRTHYKEKIFAQHAEWKDSGKYLIELSDEWHLN